MKKSTFQKRTLITALIAAFASPYAFSADIPLAQYPAGSSHKMPIPNVVLSVDDSGSMAWDDAGNNCIKSNGTKYYNSKGCSKGESSIAKSDTRIEKLKSGLNNILVNTGKYDGQLRLAWQSMWRCNNIPSSQAGCDGKNAMGVFSGQHKTDFSTWIDTIIAKDGTPSHTMRWNAGE